MQKIIAVCGLKNSGKTTLISGLVRLLSARGLKCAVIKHDGHDFSCDIPGTDTSRFTESGAYGVACFSEKRSFVHRVSAGDSYREMIGCFPEADIIFIEGAKDSAFPKIEVVRKAVSDRPVSNPAGRFLIVTDLPVRSFSESAKELNDIEGIAETILSQSEVLS